jgi:hypothetical protein
MPLSEVEQRALSGALCHYAVSGATPPGPRRLGCMAPDAALAETGDVDHIDRAGEHATGRVAVILTPYHPGRCEAAQGTSGSVLADTQAPGEHSGAHLDAGAAALCVRGRVE